MGGERGGGGVGGVLVVLDGRGGGVGVEVGVLTLCPCACEIIRRGMFDQINIPFLPLFLFVV